MTNVKHASVLDQLHQLGLSDHEANVYLAILDNGETTTGQILAHTGLHREQIYRSLSRLVERGLIITKKGSRSRYAAVDPKALVDSAKAIVDTAQSLEVALRERFTGRSQIIDVREGTEALRQVSDDILATVKKDGEYLILGGAWDVFSPIAKDYLKKYHSAFQKKNIGGRILSYQGHNAQDELAMGWHIQVRELDQTHPNLSSTIIYGDTIAIEILDPENPAVITIKNKKVADHYRQTFETLWKLGT